MRVHIDRLVVDGGLGDDPGALEAGIVAALAEALAGPHPAWWAGDATVPVVRTTLGCGTDPGARIGAAIHAGLSARPLDRGGAR